MNIPGPEEESSCKRQENGDGSTGSDRPLKKARFAWQVKGKYHLRNQTPEPTGPLSLNELDNPGSSSQNETISSDLVGNTEQNLEILGDYLLKQDFNTLDSVITDDKALSKPSTSISTESSEYPRYVCCQEHMGRKRADSILEPAVPLSMVLAQTEEQCIARWQARQMAKGFVDNTINRVLDSWLVAPLPAEVDNRFLALDVAEFINNLPGDNSIENEGILMAISAHGLQNTSNSSNNSENLNEEQVSSKEVFISPSSSPLRPEEEVIELDNNDESENSHVLPMSWQYDEETNNRQLQPFSFNDSSNTSYSNYDNEVHIPETNLGFDDEIVSSNDYASNYDFMDAAVSFAIQSKGLTSFGSDYG